MNLGDQAFLDSEHGSIVERNVFSLSRLMGHGSLPVLQRYLKQIKEDLGEVHAVHSPADNLL